MTGQQPPPGGWQPPPGQPPQWPQVPPPQPPPSSGRLVAYIIVGGLLGMVAGAFAASLLDAALNFGLLLPVVMLIAAPAGGLLGALWGMRQAGEVVGRHGRWRSGGVARTGSSTSTATEKRASSCGTTP